MKLLIVLSFAIVATSAAHAADYPICVEKSDGSTVTPCALGDADASRAFIDMILVNKDGYRMMMKTKVRNGFVSGDDRNLRVLMLTDVPLKSQAESVNQLRYDLLLNDCLGTDQCEGTYVWTVIETATAYGYSHSSKYSNYVTKSDSMAFPVPKK